MRVMESPIPANPRFKDLTGRVFGRWTVVSFARQVKNKNNTLNMWNCRCVCGVKKEVFGGSLTRGLSASCGCLQAERRTKHGDGGRSGGSSRAPEYTAYYGARTRCTKPNARSYPDYGGRGIEFRFSSYQEFLAAVGRRPSPDHSLDRIDTNGHYEAGNLRWATIHEQNRNVRGNILLTVDGVTKTLPEWAELCGLSPQTLKGRVDAGWCDACAVNLPIVPPTETGNHLGKSKKGCQHHNIISDN